MPTRKTPVVRMRKYPRNDQITIIDFLTDRIKSVEYRLRQSEQAVKILRNDHTVKQNQYDRNCVSNMLWLLSTLDVYRKTADDKLAEEIVNHRVDREFTAGLAGEIHHGGPNNTTRDV